ncbi:MAG: hypothetical protein CSA53_01380 [Gammaproteobacteria bacterium]|nr:MAG: hypothetical protein CSA53_01380 [Gammaproteobacteria bacterium]
MKLCYYHNDEKNFGDDLNAWLYPKLLPGIVDGFCAHGDEYLAQNNREAAIIYGIGTVLDHRIPPHPVKHVLGSGVGYYHKPELDERFRIHFVRGPKSATAIGLAPEIGINDPAIMLTRFIERPDPKHKYTLIMHCDTAKSGYWENIAKTCGFNYVDPRADDPISVVQELISSEHVISESLHGAIIADAFGIPWLPISAMPHINAFKWQDWGEAIGQPYEPVRLKPIYAASSDAFLKNTINSLKAKLNARALSKAVQNRSFYLSDRARLQKHIDLIDERLKNFRKEVTGET